MNTAFLARIFIVLTLVLGSVAFVASNVSAKNDNTTRPGWGYGDQNHEHTGPPGQSVNPNNVPKAK